MMCATSLRCERAVEKAFTGALRASGHRYAKRAQCVFLGWLSVSSPEQHEQCRRANPFLGVVSNFSDLQLGYVVIRIKEKRMRKRRACT